jgi:hypothetical protein
MTSEQSRDGGGPDADGQTSWSFALLLGPADLPGGHWAIEEERSWPTGRLDPESAKNRRALEAGGITAWRKLAEAGTPRSAWAEVVPYSTAEDAAQSLVQVPGFFLGALHPDETVLDERVVHGREVPGLPGPWILDKSTRGPQGDVEARYVAGTVGTVLSITCFSGRAGDWTWPDIVRLSAAQADAVRRAVGVARDR